MGQSVDDDADQGGCVFSFENIGRLEAAKTACALLQIENLLQTTYDQSAASSDGSTSDATHMEDETPFEHYRRVESEGYDAHSERVDIKEVLSWQSAFPYLAANGEQVKAIYTQVVPPKFHGDFHPTLTNNIDQTCETGSATDSNLTTFSGINNLVVEGRQCSFSDRSNDNNAIDVTDGILEELIAINVTPADSPSTSDEGNYLEGNLPSPHSSRRDEIVSLLLDALWPEVIEVCRPLVKKVVEVSRRENITYDLGKRIVEDESDDNSVENGYASW